MQPHVEFTHEFTHGFTPFGEWTSINQLYFSVHSQGLEENSHITHGVSLETDPASSPKRSWQAKRCQNVEDLEIGNMMEKYHPIILDFHIFSIFSGFL